LTEADIYWQGLSPTFFHTKDTLASYKYKLRGGDKFEGNVKFLKFGEELFFLLPIGYTIFCYC
jgi:hypothetical protein